LPVTGIDFIIIDDDPAPTEQSRAAIVHVRTLEIWDKLGFVQNAISQGVKIRSVQVRERGRDVANLELAADRQAADTPFPYALGLPQSETEKLYVADLLARGGLIEWNTRLNALDCRDGEVLAHVSDKSGGERTIAARWVIGADGAQSVVRRSLAVDFPGGTYEIAAFLADVIFEVPQSEGELYLNLAHGGFVGILPLGRGRFRLFGAVPDSFVGVLESNGQRNVPVDLIQSWFDDYFNVNARIATAEWTSLYQVHRCIAGAFRVGSCFLVGDAAHIHAPAGGQGMNLSIGDAFNLAWKLALVTRGDAHPALVDSYELERRPIAEQVLKGSDRGFELEVTNNLLLERFRVHVFPLVLRVAGRFQSFREMVFELFSQLWINYRASPVVAEIEHVDGPHAGDRAPYGVFQAGEYRGVGIFELTNDVQHHVLIFEGVEARATLEKVTADVRAILKQYRMGDVQIVPIISANTALHHRYDANRSRLFLVRPDGHIGFEAPLDRLVNFEQYLRSLYVESVPK